MSEQEDERYPNVRPLLIQRLRTDLLDSGLDQDEAETVVSEVLEWADKMREKWRVA